MKEKATKTEIREEGTEENGTPCVREEDVCKCDDDEKQ